MSAHQAKVSAACSLFIHGTSSHASERCQPEAAGSSSLLVAVSPVPLERSGNESESPAERNECHSQGHERHELHESQSEIGATSASRRLQPVSSTTDLVSGGTLDLINSAGCCGGEEATLPFCTDSATNSLKVKAKNISPDPILSTDPAAIVTSTAHPEPHPSASQDNSFPLLNHKEYDESVRRVLTNPFDPDEYILPNPRSPLLPEHLSLRHDAQQPPLIVSRLGVDSAVVTAPNTATAASPAVAPAEGNGTSAAAAATACFAGISTKSDSAEPVVVAEPAELAEPAAEPAELAGAEPAVLAEPAPRKNAPGMQFQVVPHGARPLATAEALCAMTRAELVAELRSLQADHEKYRQEVAFQKDLLASVGQSVICTDLAGTITYWNKAAEAMYGWREEEAVGRSIIEITPADTTVQQAGEIFAALTRGDVWRGEFLVRRRDGSPFHAMVTDTPILDPEGKLVGVIGVSADISDLKRKESEIRALNAALEQRVEERTEQLMRSNEALKSEIEQHLRAQEHLRHCIRDLEASRDKISQQSAALERLVGQLREARVEAESANRLKSRFLASMSHEIRTPMNGVLGMTRLLLSTPLQEEQRQFVDTIRSSGDALLTILNDILDLSKIEAGELELEHRDFDLCRCLEDAVSLLAIRAMEKGVAVVSFVEPNVPRVVRSDSARLRQILVNLISNAIKFTERGEVEVTVSATRLPGSSEQHMPELLEESAKQQTDGGSGDMRMEDSSGGMHEEEQEQEEAKEEGISIKGGVMSPGDSAHSGFAVWGKAVSSRRRWRGEETQGMERHGVHCIAVSVRDTGIGIPKERMKRLFKPFSQVDASMTRKYGGTGLGLAISHQLVGMLGGRIRAESDGQGRGSTFRFYITAPALPFDLNTPVEAQRRSPAPPDSAAASLALLSHGHEAAAATASLSAVPALHPSLASPAAPAAPAVAPAAPAAPAVAPAAPAASAVPLPSAAAAGLLRKRKREVEPHVAAAVAQGPSQDKRYAAAACCCSSSCQCCCCCCWKDGVLTSDGETLRKTEGESGRAADKGCGRQDGKCATQTRCSSSGRRVGGEGCALIVGGMEWRKGGTEEGRGDPGETTRGDGRSEEVVSVRGRESDRWGEGVEEGGEGVSEGANEVEAAVAGWERSRRRAEGRSALVVLPHASTRRMVCRHLASLGFRVGEASSGEEADRVMDEGVVVLGGEFGGTGGEEGRRCGSDGEEGREEGKEFNLFVVDAGLHWSPPARAPPGTVATLGPAAAHTGQAGATEDMALTRASPEGCRNEPAPTQPAPAHPATAAVLTTLPLLTDALGPHSATTPAKVILLVPYGSRQDSPPIPGCHVVVLTYPIRQTALNRLVCDLLSPSPLASLSSHRPSLPSHSPHGRSTRVMASAVSVSSNECSQNNCGNRIQCGNHTRCGNQGSGEGSSRCCRTDLRDSLPNLLLTARSSERVVGLEPAEAVLAGWVATRAEVDAVVSSRTGERAAEAGTVVKARAGARQGAATAAAEGAAAVAGAVERAVAMPSMAASGAEERATAAAGASEVPSPVAAVPTSGGTAGACGGGRRVRGRGAAKAGVDAAGFQSGLAQQHPLNILLAEDNLVNQKVATKMLGRMGYTCHVAVNGAEVLQALQKDSFDLVFMDVQMPVMDGIEATQRITQMWPPSQRPKIFAMTANVLETDRAMCLQAGMDGFISKPVSVHELVRAVEFSSLSKR